MPLVGSGSIFDENWVAPRFSGPTASGNREFQQWVDSSPSWRAEAAIPGARLSKCEAKVG